MARDWLAEKFTEFYLEVQRQVSAIRHGRSAPVDDGEEAPEEGRRSHRGPHPSWDAVSAVLRRQEQELREGVGVGFEVYKQAQYAMVCLAHDVFTLHLGDWPGRDGWLSQPLEKEFFGHTIGGGEVFEKIKKLLGRRDSPSRDTREIAQIYYNILSLGFLGKYHEKARGGKPPPEIEGYRKELQAAFEGFGTGGDEPKSVISTQPYATVRAGSPVSPITPPAPGRSLAFLGIAAVLLGLTLFLSVRQLRSGIERSCDSIAELEKKFQKPGSTDSSQPSPQPK